MCGSSRWGVRRPVHGVPLAGWVLAVTLLLAGCAAGEVSPPTSTPPPVGTVEAPTAVSSTTTTTVTMATTSTTSPVALDPREATRRLEVLMGRAEQVLAGSGDANAIDEIAAEADRIDSLISIRGEHPAPLDVEGSAEADRISGLTSDESADPRYWPTLDTVRALVRAARDGTEIGPLLDPEQVEELPAEGVAVDLGGVIALVGLDGTVTGHVDRYRIDYRFITPGPVVLEDVDGNRWILDGEGLREGDGVPPVGDALSIVRNDGWEVRRGDTVVFAADKETEFFVSAHRDVVTATRWDISNMGNPFKSSAVAIDVTDGSEVEIPTECVVIDRYAGRYYLACTTFRFPSGDDLREEISEIRTLDGEVLVPSAARDYEIPSGHWVGGEVSPDGSMLLLQWSAECEIPVAFFAPAAGGDPVGYDGGDTPESFGLGWTSGGQALVVVTGEGACGTGAEQPGIYLMDGPGDGRLIYPVPHTWGGRLWRGGR